MIVSPIEQLRANRLPLQAMVQRNLKGRYENSFIGIQWNFITPVLLTVAIWLVFTEVKTFHTEIDFWYYLAIGMFSMTPFLSAVKGRVFYNNKNYITKTSVPRWVQVLADVIQQFIVLLLSFAILISIAVVYGHHLSIAAMLFLPVAFFLMFAMCLGCTFLISTLNVVTNDVGHQMTVIGRILVWLTPIFFFINDAGPMLRLVATFNPITYFVEMLHQSLYYSQIPEIEVLTVAVIFATSFLLLGWAVFKYYDKELAERLRWTGRLLRSGT